MLLDALTVFLGAFLLFQIQPIIAAYVLPWFGGTAAVWTVCMLFFQVALLLGYAYAHAASRALHPRLQVMVHVGLLIASLAVLPVIPSDGWKPHGDEVPAARILVLLAATIGLPYFLLSTTGPLVQLWLFRRVPDARPYRLFALGNVAALVALVAYPFLVQPALGVRRQIDWWSAAYAAYVILATLVAVRSLGAAGPLVQPVRPPAAGDDAIPRPTMLLWIALAACPSVLLLAVTNYLTRDVAPIPLLWVLPLSLYLASFVLCFDHPRWYRPKLLRLLVPVIIVAWMFEPSVEVLELGLSGVIALFAVGLFACCMVCHGELARLKPDPRHLTTFYLMVAVGGAAGGVFVGLVAPALFVTYFELPLGLAGCVVLVLIVLYRETSVDRRAGGRRVLALALAIVLIHLGVEVRGAPPGNRVRVRNFFGSLSTRDFSGPSGDRRVLLHGKVTHGQQFLAATRRREPTSYYGRQSGAGLVLGRLGERGPLRVGIVGLGAGVLAAYARAGDYYRFYEINPLVERLARSEFTFLADSPATTDVVIGDARLVLEREPEERFDVLVLDAFSGDSVPTHLLTLEAFGCYFRHLRKDGVLAVHISNHYLDLRPIVAGAAAAWDRRAWLVANDGNPELGTGVTWWALVIGPEGPALDAEPAAALLSEDPRLHAWMDDYSSLLQVLR